MKINENLGFQIPSILLPKRDLDFQKWAVIACDQYTSEPEYWHDVETFVGDAPSTLKMVLPEVYLETDFENELIERTKKNMQDYLDQDIFQSLEGLILVERQTENNKRHGVMVALDLEKYDFNKGSQTLIRASEGTILDRLPPRIRIREGAKLEFPHILVLIDDPNYTVIEPLVEKKDQFRKIYDFDLMKKSGHLTGYLVPSDNELKQFVEAIENLAKPERFYQHYQVDKKFGVLLFAMGDGNHSLATAKSIWEEIKDKVSMDHPARYALVEIENIHDQGLEFEPIHRVLFNLQLDILEKMKTWWGESLRVSPSLSQAEMIEQVDHQSPSVHKIGFINPHGYFVLEIKNPESNLPVGTLQPFLDSFMKQKGAGKIDYVHGWKVTCELGKKENNCGYYLPAMEKDQLFKTIIVDGALPRKTFSMGEADEKRFYMEGRKITP